MSPKGHVLVIVLFLLITLIMTYPLVFHLGDGVVDNLGDPLFNSWVLSWDTHALTSNPLQLFNANIFYPYRNTLAYSEHLFSTSLLFAPILLISGNPIFSTNLILLLSFVMSAYGMFLLARRLTANKYASFAAGIIFAFSAYKLAHIGHLQLMTAQWIPFMFFFAHRYVERKDGVSLLGLWIFFVLEVLSSWYYAFFVAIGLVVFFVYFILVRKLRLNLRLLLHLVLFSSASALAFLPFAVPYYLNQLAFPAFRRSLTETIAYSASLVDYLRVPPYNLLYGSFFYKSFQRLWGGCEHALFPGLLTLVFATFGLLTMIWKPEDRLNKGFYFTLAGASFILSLGPYPQVLGHLLKVPLPYLVLYKLLPGFQAMRAPSRFGIMVMFALAVLAAYGFSAFGQVLSRRLNKKWSQLALIGFSLILVVEFASLPFKIPHVPVGRDIPTVYGWLAAQPEDTVVVELPTIRFAGKTPVMESWALEARYLYFSTYHWKRLVNGYSGWYPPPYMETMRQISSFSGSESITLLRKLNVSYVIIHRDSFSEREWTELEPRLKRQKGLKMVKKFGQDYVYRVQR